MKKIDAENLVVAAAILAAAAILDFAFRAPDILAPGNIMAGYESASIPATK